MSKEIWKDLKYLTQKGKWIDFQGVYQVSNYGRIRSFRAHNGGKCYGRLSETPRLLKVAVAKNGYHRVGLVVKDGEKNRPFLLHRAVASTFIEIPSYLREEKEIDVNHKDEVKANNMVENLVWCTRLENNNHGTRTERAVAKGRLTKSSSEWKAKHSGGLIHNSRKVIGVSIKDGSVLELDSMNQADDYFNIPLAGRSVSATIRGKQKTAYGYKWYYKEDYETKQLIKHV